MVLLTVGKEAFMELIKDDLTNGSYGTSSTAPLKSDTGLIAEVSATVKSLIKSRTSTQLTLTHTLLSTEGNGNTYREFGNKLSLAQLNRVSLADLEKTSSEEFQTTTIISVI